MGRNRKPHFIFHETPPIFRIRSGLQVRGSEESDEEIQNAGESQCQPSNQVQKKKSRFNADESTDAVMFVQATEDAKLRKDIQRCADRHKMKLKVVEKVESNVSKQLQRSNPFKEETCGKPDCQICKRSKGINCRTRGCVYEMKCCECDRKYRGQTGNSAQERINQHFQDWERKVEACPLYRHSVLYHGGRKFPVSVRILRACFGDPTARRITESVLIDELTSAETMNGKNEWTYIKPKLDKLSMI